MAGVAQMVRASDCGPGGRGFDSHLSPHISVGVSPSGKAPDFDSGIRRFKSCHPSQKNFMQYGPLAQVVEHLTFNQVVRSSNLRWLRKTKKHSFECFFCFSRLSKICTPFD